MTTSKKQKWGGKREGAGRKPKGELSKQTVAISLDPAIIKWIDTQSDNRSRFIAELLTAQMSQPCG